MKIKHITIFEHALHVVNGPYRYSGGTLEAVTSYLIKLESDTGEIGWGETCPLGPTYQPAHAKGARAALEELAPHLIEAEALPRVCGAIMDKNLRGHNYAKAAFDIAIYDLLGHSLGVPVSTLLGGALRDRIPSYYAVRMDTPDETAKLVADKCAEGYRALQIKIGCGDIRQDAEVLHAATRAATRGTVITADANRALTTNEVLHLSRLIQDLPIALEQPCESLEEHLALVGRINHPIYLDESTEDIGVVMRAMARGDCDSLGMKLTRVGGLSAMMTIRDMAATRRAMMSVDDCWGGDIIAAACVHMGATVDPRLFRGTWIAAPYIEHHYDDQNPIQAQDGEIAVPTHAGLGVTPNEALFGPPILEL